MQLAHRHDTAQLPSHASAGKHATARPLDILMVEDTDSDALLARLSLDRTGVPYRLRTLRAGSDLIPCLFNHRHSGSGGMPDLIMLDLGLPGMNGFDVLEALAATHASMRHVPIVILTGYEHFDYLQKNTSLPIVAYMRKPCHTEKMRTILASITP